MVFYSTTQVLPSNNESNHLAERELVQDLRRLAFIYYTASYECGAVVCVELFNKLYMLLMDQGVPSDDTFGTISMYNVCTLELARMVPM